MKEENEIDWKEVARNFWFACEHGDIGFVEVLIKNYAPYFKEKEEDE